MRRWCLTLTVVGLILLATPRPATAGPIDWTYRASVVAGPHQDRLYTGSEAYWPDTGVPVTLYGFVEFPHAFSGSGTGSEAGVRLAGLSKAAYEYRAEPPGPDGLDAVYLRVEVTDAASGQTGSADLFLGAYLLSALPGEVRAEAYIHAGGDLHFVLGGNRYDLAVSDGYTESGSWISASVTVAAATPEPATVALAGLGLAGVGLTRFRRRRAEA
jgi:hypothetical protein